MEATARFFRHALLSYKGLFGWLDPKVYVMVIVLGPLSQLVFFACLARYVYQGQDISGFVASNALLLCVVNSIFGILTVVRSDRSMGTLQLVVASPANKFATFLARSLFHIINGFVTAIIGLVVGVLVFDVSLLWSSIPTLILIWIVSIFAVSGFGLVLGSLSFWSPSVHLWSNLVADLLLLLSGANYARSAMPEWMAQTAQWFPLTRGVELTKEIVSTGRSDQLWTLLAQEVSIGSAYFLLGIVCIQYAERIARSKGTLDLD